MSSEPPVAYPVGRFDPAPDILVVCTANIARSPLFAARLKSEAGRRLGPDVAMIESAGVDAAFGRAAARGSRTVANHWGMSLEAHASKSIVYSQLEAIPLKITMTRGHVRALCARNRDLAATTFTALELLQCVERLKERQALPAAGPPPGDREAFRSHLIAVTDLANKARSRRGPFTRSMDIPDPIGGDQVVYDHLGHRFVEVAEGLGQALFGPSPS
jgi:protein-tyrosine-phosphatase